MSDNPELIILDMLDSLDEHVTLDDVAHTLREELLPALSEYTGRLQAEARAEGWDEGWRRGFRDFQAAEVDEDGYTVITPSPNPHRSGSTTGDSKP